MKKIIFLVSLLFITLTCIGGVIGYKYYSEKPKLEIIGEDNVSLVYGDEYNDLGASASVHKKNISSNIKVNNNIDTKKIGEYKVDYTLEYHKKEYKVTRTIKVVDKTNPIITLKGNTVTIYQGNKYIEPGYMASDNYDGDITSKVIIKSNLDTKKVGTYDIVYSVLDSSNNETKITRKVIVK